MIARRATNCAFAAILASIAASGFHHRQPDLLAAQPGNHVLLTLRRARLRQPQLQRADARISLQLGNIDTDNPALLCHPSIPFLARAGSHAHATVRVEGSTGPVPRSPSGSASGGDGLRSSDGRLLFTAARSHTLSNFRHTRVAAGVSPRRVRVFPVVDTLTRLALLGTFSRSAGEGLNRAFCSRRLAGQLAVD